MADLLFYIFVGVQILLSFIFMMSQINENKNRTKVKTKYQIIAFTIMCLLDAGLIMTYAFRSLEGWEDLIMTIAVYIMHALLFLSFLYIASLQMYYEGKVLVVKSIFKKHEIDIEKIIDVSVSDKNFVIDTQEKQYKYNLEYLENSKLILSNLDISGGETQTQS